MYKTPSIFEPFHSSQREYPTKSNLIGITDKQVDVATLVLCTFHLFLLPFLSLDFGMTWDQFFQDYRGGKTLDFFRGYNSSESLKSMAYGTLFETVCVYFQQLFHDIPSYKIRHVLGALSSWGCIVFSVLLARRVFNRSVGLLVAILLPISPYFIGHAFNNTKDGPFATAYILGLLALSFLNKKSPYLTKYSAIFITLTIAISMGIRFTGALLLFYFFIFITVHIFKEKKAPKLKLKAMAPFVFVVLSLPLIVPILWPSLLNSPIESIANTLTWSFKQVKSGNYVLLMGDYYPVHNLPYYYNLIYFSVKTPLLILIPFFISIIFCLHWKNSWKVKGLLFALLFPLAFSVIVSLPQYNEVRHLFFLYPVMVIFGAAGIWKLFSLYTGGRQLTMGLCFIVLAFFPLSFQFKNHPYQSVYYNKLVGGTFGAESNFTLDYSGVCLKDAVGKANDIAIKENKVLTIGADGAGHNVRRYTRYFPNLEYSEWLNDVDVFITQNAGHTSPIKAKKNLLGKPIDSVSVDGVGLCYLYASNEYSRSTKIRAFGISNNLRKKEKYTFWPLRFKGDVS